MRLAAAALFAVAAFNWTIPFVDRAGVAMLAFAFVALSVGRYMPRVRRPRFAVPKRPALLDDQGRIDDSRIEGLDAKLAAYGMGAAGAAGSSSATSAEGIEAA